MPIALPVTPEANELLSRNALALLIGMLLDQQVPLERAFSAPADLAARLGHEPTARELAGCDPAALIAVFSQTACPPSLSEGNGRPHSGARAHDRR